MQKKYTLDGIGPITITKRKNSKRLRLTIKPNGKVQVSMPIHSSYKNALAFVKQNKNWIQQKLSDVNNKYQPTQLREGDIYTTAYHEIHFLRANDNHWHYTKHGKQIQLFIPDTANEELNNKQLKQFIIEILRKEAKHYLPERVYQYAADHNLKVNKVFIKNLRSIWGSCSSLHNINLNLHLMRLPEDLRDYVIYHELAHLKVHNHSSSFWAYLESLYPHAREHAKQLRQYSTQIL